MTPSANPLSGVVESLREQVASLQETHIFSATALNTARFGFSRASYYFTGTTSSQICLVGSQAIPSAQWSSAEAPR